MLAKSLPHDSSLRQPSSHCIRPSHAGRAWVPEALFLSLALSVSLCVSLCLLLCVSLCVSLRTSQTTVRAKENEILTPTPAKPMHTSATHAQLWKSSPGPHSPTPASLRTARLWASAATAVSTLYSEVSRIRLRPSRRAPRTARRMQSGTTVPPSPFLPTVSSGCNTSLTMRKCTSAAQADAFQML